ncbi:guanine nucleotide-binding subunit gamma 3 [Olea europaea subsp. europaea]|uniref:Guanine nucleotide-binding subunit gamma 3 n=1 Tax=Olea europaea subsp. europaea TaxID=158383 RepID=A0A8S0Q617_OLEEU|nr:guanine nucleotide-binding subunit gamma 3 [Olea europaea subsp. europaea]
MKGSGSGDSWPLPPPRPKSPPEYPDLYGKRRGLVNVQTMEREIGFLEEELKSVESLQPASRACKEVVDFVSGNADPLIPVTKKTRRSCSLSFGFWKWLCESSCFNLSWICCCGCYPHLEISNALTSAYVARFASSFPAPFLAENAHVVVVNVQT